jgi:hypothetical protein
MPSLIVPGQPAGGPRQMSIAVGIVLMTATVGAILLLALTAGSPHWLNLRIVGVILILAGVLGPALPPGCHAPLHEHSAAGLVP